MLFKCCLNVVYMSAKWCLELLKYSLTRCCSDDAEMLLKCCEIVLKQLSQQFHNISQLFSRSRSFSQQFTTFTTKCCSAACQNTRAFVRRCPSGRERVSGVSSLRKSARAFLPAAERGRSGAGFGVGCGLRFHLVLSLLDLGR